MGQFPCVYLTKIFDSFKLPLTALEVQLSVGPSVVRQPLQQKALHKGSTPLIKAAFKLGSTVPPPPQPSWLEKGFLKQHIKKALSSTSILTFLYDLDTFLKRILDQVFFLYFFILYFLALLVRQTSPVRFNSPPWSTKLERKVKFIKFGLILNRVEAWYRVYLMAGRVRSFDQIDCFTIGGTVT